MAGNLTPDTNMALLQATQVSNGTAAKTLKSASGTKNLEKIEAAAQEFEAVFMAEMLKPMFEGLSPEAPFGGGKGEEVFQSFLLKEYGNILAQTGNIGIADQVKEQMIQMQEQADKGTTRNE